MTNSDANNGDAFSVPRACAKSIFPPLDLATPFPSQQLSVTDVCCVVWTFCLVYRGNPKRYLFTTGWSAFVDEKQLVSGDTIVFIKNSVVKIFVGIRRKNMFVAAIKITEKTFMNAVELVGKNTPFEVVLYPTVDGFDFVVGDKVDGFNGRASHKSDNHSILNSFGENLTAIHNSKTEKSRPHFIILFGQRSCAYLKKSLDDSPINPVDGREK
ncbi:auxin response factor 17-like [Lathyrus oleraceus]|uniref:auxin response factor 17-like n=1 Tax=Pisum sativum TaxID=3888 RepID=UPI001FC42C27|nr:auxin response factor 17-like [Pisum sativum]